MMKKLIDRLSKLSGPIRMRLATAPSAVAGVLRDQRGQGTTEYAILVGVLVVIAILAITVIRGPIESLWNRIIEAVSSLG